MVESNLRFVVAYAKRYRNPNVAFLDLIHEGNLGLIQAAKKYYPFEEGHDVKFITYAVWWIRQAILHALAEHAGSFRLPQKQANNLYRLERIRSLLSDRNSGASPTDPELARELGLSVDDVRVLTQASQSSLSLNEPVDVEGDSELGDLLEQTVLPDTDETDPPRVVPGRSGRCTLRTAGPRAAGAASFGSVSMMTSPRPFVRSARFSSLSRERVRQIESRALNRLRRSHKTQSLAGYLQ